MLLVYKDSDGKRSGQIGWYLYDSIQPCYNLCSQILSTCKLLFCEGHEILYANNRLLIVFEVGPMMSSHIRAQIGNLWIGPCTTSVDSRSGRVSSVCSKFRKFDVKIAFIRTRAPTLGYLAKYRIYDVLISFLYRLQIILKEKDIYLSFDYHCREAPGAEKLFSKDYLPRLCSAFGLLRCKVCEFPPSQAEYWSAVARVITSEEPIVDLPYHFNNFKRYHNTLSEAIESRRLHDWEVDMNLRSAKRHAMEVEEALYSWNAEAFLEHRAMSFKFLNYAQKLALQTVFAEDDEHAPKAPSELDLQELDIKL